MGGKRRAAAKTAVPHLLTTASAACTAITRSTAIGSAAAAPA